MKLFTYVTAFNLQLSASFMAPQELPRVCYHGGDGVVLDNASGALAARGSHFPGAAVRQPETWLLLRSINHVSLLNAVFKRVKSQFVFWILI